MHIGDKLTLFEARQPHKIAIYFEDEAITYARFVKNVKRFQHRLLKHVESDEAQKVALCIDNEPAFLEMYFAVITLGWIAVPLDAKWTKKEAEQHMQLAKPDLIVGSRQFEKLANYQVRATFMIEEVSEEQFIVEKKVTADTAFYLGFTSGSTGQSKAFVRSHQSWLASFAAAEKAFHYGQEDMILATGPLAYSLSLFATVHAIHIGASICLLPKFTVKKTMHAIVSKQVSVVHAVPTMLADLARHKAQVKNKITFISAGAKLLPNVREKAMKVFPNSHIFEYYGASELSLVSYANKEIAENYPASVGKPFEGVNVTIRDQAGNLLPCGDIGQIYIESDFVFKGYIDNETENQKVLTAYGATTSDLGYLNEAGYLFILGRNNNMLIRGGQNVYPEEIEKVIKAVPSVKEAVVIGVEDERWGEQIWALIQWEDVGDMKHLRSFCRQHIASHKRPHKYVVVDHFPYTSTGKIDRKNINIRMGVR